MEPQMSSGLFRNFMMFIAAMACSTVAGCGTASGPSHDLPPERLAQLRNICTDTMQLSPGTAHFEDCLYVLSETARQVDKAKAMP